MSEWNLPRARCSWTAFVGFITKITEKGGALVPGQRVHGGGFKLAIDPGYLRFAYRAPLASDGRGPVVFLVRFKPLHATRPLVPGRRCVQNKMSHLPVLRSELRLQ